MKRTFAADFVSSLLVLLFTYTALSKLLSLHQFTTTLRELPWLKPGAAVLAAAVPLTELGIALLLVFASTRRLGLWLSLFLLSGFTGFLICLVGFHYHLPCSCGGVIAGMSWTTHIAFNLFFIALTGFALVPKQGNTHTIRTTEKVQSRKNNAHPDQQPAGLAENL